MDSSNNIIDLSSNKFGIINFDGFGFNRYPSEDIPDINDNIFVRTPKRIDRKVFKKPDDYIEAIRTPHHFGFGTSYKNNRSILNNKEPINNYDISGCEQKEPFLCDVVFSFDTTGSMRNVIRSVRNNLVETVDRLFKEIEGIRIGIIVHGDYCDKDGFFWKMDLNRDIDKIKKFIKSGPDTGGGDAAECYEFVLQQANEMNWKSDVRVLVVIGDEEPHEKGYEMPIIYNGFQSKLHIDWRQETMRLLNNNITVFSCHANPESNTHAIPFYNHISNTTKGYYFPLNELQSFNHYMVTICMRAADAAEDLKLLRQQQKELNDKIESGAFSKKEAEILRTESTNIEDAINSSAKDGIFSPNTKFNTRTRELRSTLKVQSRTESYINELNTTVPTFRSSSSTAFVNTVNTYNIDVPKSS